MTKALEVTEKALRECDKGEERPSYETRTADALVAMAETALANDPKARQGADRYHILLHADIATLQGEQGVAELHEGPGLHPETLRRLACDASVTPVIERDGEPLNVGNKTRTIPARIDRALKARDRHCQFPGCRRTCLTERHHIRWVVRHGDNSIENLVVLCWHHHRLVHEGGFGVARENGVLVFRRPDGVPIREPTQATPKGPALVERHRAAGMAIDAETMPRWNGDTMDRDIAVHVLLQSDDLLRWPPLPKPGAESDGDEAGRARRAGSRADRIYTVRPPGPVGLSGGRAGLQVGPGPPRRTDTRGRAGFTPVRSCQRSGREEPRFRIDWRAERIQDPRDPRL